jgi:hypothetical protein
MSHTGEDALGDNWLDKGKSYCTAFLNLTPSTARLVLRVQFLESKVNLNRWAEEIKLVNVEISFTIGSFEYRARYWMARASGGFSPGEIAHGYHMAAFYNAMAKCLR